MLANFLEKSKPINFIVYLSVFFCFFLLSLITHFFNDGFSWNKTFESVVFFFLFLIIFFFYNFIVTKNKLTFDHSYAFFIFTLIAILHFSFLFEFKPLITFILHLLYLRKIYSLRSSKSIIQKLFDSGFWLGVLFILEPYCFVFFLVTLTAILLYQKLTIQNLIAPIIGYITPLIIYFTYLFWVDTTNNFIKLFTVDFIFDLSTYTKNSTTWSTLILLLFTLIALILKSPKAMSVNNSFKKSWQLLIINLLVSLFFAILTNTNQGYETLFLYVPASIIIANGFEVLQKRMVKNILIFIFMMGTIIGFCYL